jgi:hypothetical protein
MAQTYASTLLRLVEEAAKAMRRSAYCYMADPFDTNW